MSVSGLSGAGFNFALLAPGSASKSSRSGGVDQDRAGSSRAADVFSAVLQRVAEFRSQRLDVLTGSALGADDKKGQQSLGQLLSSLNSAKESPVSHASHAGDCCIGGLSPTGRNTALFDPESAFGMMSRINNHEVGFKAQFAEISEMGSALSEIREKALVLGEISGATDNEQIKSSLAAFAGEYNNWVSRFDASMLKGGLLAGTQAAQVSRHELEQSVGNIFNGAKEGLHGLRDLGFTIDPVSKLAVVDNVRLDAVLAGNPQGVVATLHEFSANFAQSAELLNSNGNFIPNRLGNLGRVIDYLDSNKASLQAEFGLGSIAKPSPLIAQALASYQRIRAL